MFKKITKQVPKKSLKLQCSQNIQCSQNRTQITSIKLSTLEANLLMLANKAGVKQSTKFGAFMKHTINLVLTKQRTDHQHQTLNP